MAKIKMNFTIPQDVIDRLASQVPKGQRSEFASNAISEKLEKMEQEALSERLKEGYIARREEDAQINELWGTATV